MSSYKSSFLTVVLILFASITLVTSHIMGREYLECHAAMVHFCDNLTPQMIDCTRAGFLKYNADVPAPDYIHSYFRSFVFERMIVPADILQPKMFCSSKELYESQEFATHYAKHFSALNEDCTDSNFPTQNIKYEETPNIDQSKKAILKFRMKEKCLADLKEFETSENMLRFAFFQIDEYLCGDNHFAKMYLNYVSRSVNTINIIEESPENFCVRYGSRHWRRN